GAVVEEREAPVDRVVIGDRHEVHAALLGEAIDLLGPVVGIASVGDTEVLEGRVDGATVQVRLPEPHVVEPGRTFGLGVTLGRHSISPFGAPIGAISRGPEAKTSEYHPVFTSDWGKAWLSAPLWSPARRGFRGRGLVRVPSLDRRPVGDGSGARRAHPRRGADGRPRRGPPRRGADRARAVRRARAERARPPTGPGSRIAREAPPGGPCRAVARPPGAPGSGAPGPRAARRGREAVAGIARARHGFLVPRSVGAAGDRRAGARAGGSGREGRGGSRPHEPRS